VITVMGHVDHGKTTLLDALRGTNVAEREAGGITQGVAAFSVAMRASASGVGDRRAPGGKAPKASAASAAAEGDEEALLDEAASAAPSKAANDRSGRKKAKDNKKAAAASASATPASSSSPASPAVATAVDVMTFIDTPGHALFSSMRQRGSSITDCVVLVVDGKDGPMPQTKECVDLILGASIPCVVAVTKCDVVDPATAVQKIAASLLELGLATEPFGGDIPLVPVSAKTGMGLQELKDTLQLQTEMLDLRAKTDAMGEAAIMDARVVKGMGQVVDVIVRWGTLKVGDFVVAGSEFGRIKSLLTDATGAASVNKRLLGGAGSDAADKKNGDKKKKEKEKGNNGAKDDEEGAGNGFVLTQVKEALPGTPVRVLGLKGCPAAGDDLLVVQDEETAKAVIEGRSRRAAAHELLKVAAADAVKRAAERDEYKMRRQRKAAHDLAVQRERKRYKIRKAGGEIPPDLILQPWESAILQEGREGRVAGIGTTGGKLRQQGGQQSNVGMSYRTADALAQQAQDGTPASAAGNGQPPQVAFILKADSSGSLVALQDAITKISEQTQAVFPRVIASAVGEVTEKDVERGKDMGAHILAFNAKISPAVQKLADKAEIKLRGSRVIYHLLDEVCDLLGEYLPIEHEEETVAVAEIKQVFTLNASKKTDPDKVAGCVIQEGTFVKNLAKYRVTRDGVAVGEAVSLSSLQHLKDKVESVKKGQDCGMSLTGFNDFMVGDKIVAIRIKQKKQRLQVQF
jgi:translation initiation factor IF-2